MRKGRFLGSPLKKSHSAIQTSRSLTIFILNLPKQMKKKMPRGEEIINIIPLDIRIPIVSYKIDSYVEANGPEVPIYEISTEGLNHIPPVELEPGEIFESEDENRDSKLNSSKKTDSTSPEKEKNKDQDKEKDKKSEKDRETENEKGRDKGKDKEKDKDKEKSNNCKETEDKNKTKAKKSSKKKRSHETSFDSYSSSQLFFPSRKTPIQIIDASTTKSEELVPTLATKRTKIDLQSIKPTKLKRHDTSSTFLEIKKERQQAFRSQVDPIKMEDTNHDAHTSQVIDNLLRQSRRESCSSNSSFKIPKRSSNSSSSVKKDQHELIFTVQEDRRKYPSTDLVHLIPPEFAMWDPPYDVDDLYCIYILPLLKKQLQEPLPPRVDP